MNILHIETCQIKRIRRFTFALATFLTNHGRLNAAASLTVESQTQVRQFAGKVLRILEFQRLHLVVLEAVAGTGISTLLNIQLIGRLIPYIPHIIDSEMILDAVF